MTYSASTPPFSDADARRRIRDSLDESLIVEAAAGTGKTSELVRRIVSVLQAGRASVGGIVAVTFTRKAAGELKLRLRHALDETRTHTDDDIQKHRLESAMMSLEEAHIGTIHSFCADILRDRPVEAGLEPGFEELDEKEAPRLFERVFNRWAQDTLSDPPRGLKRALDRAASWDFSDRTPLQQIRNAAWRLIEWRDFPASWRRERFEREGEIDVLVREIVELAEIASRCPNSRDELRKALQPTLDFVSRLKRIEAIGPRDFDDLEVALTQLIRALRFRKKKGRGRFSDQHSRVEVLQMRERLIDALDDFKVRADADLAAELREELRELVDRYDAAKRQTGTLDFVDLLISARNLIRDNAAVRAFLQQRFTHVFVDEFQDTDPLQAEVLLLLSSDSSDTRDWRRTTPVPGKLFLVGDPKQSIYRFRRADFNLYRTLRDQLISRNVGLVYLTRSFRAVPDLQNLINAAFAPEMKEDARAGQPGYVGLERHRPPSQNQPEVVALPVGKPYGWYGVTKSAIEACLPETIGAYLEWLLTQSGWSVHDPSDPDAGLVPIAPRHICILFRRFVASGGREVTADYVHALEKRSVPHLLWGARSFHHREEVATLRVALAAIERPDDELSVYATLHGSLFAISDSDLLQYRMKVGRLRPFGKPVAGDLAQFAHIREALEFLASLHRRRNWQPFGETIHSLLNATRAHSGFALRPSGNQVLANIYRIVDFARAFESRGGVSFRGFVEQLISDADNAERTESPALEEGADGVRVMTVHAAKGLEFPVVIVADITANLSRAAPEKHVDTDRGLCAMRILGCSPWDLLDHEDEERQRDAAEGVRIAYVAATRARDLLIVPVVGDEPVSGWAGTLNKALYPLANARRDAVSAPRCPPFGPVSVLDRPIRLIAEEEQSVRPGLHHLDQGHAVVWWDPSLLKLDVPGNFGIPQENLLARDRDPAAAEASVARYHAWRNHLEERSRKGSTPTSVVFAAGEAEVPPASARAVKRVDPERVARLPAGPRFGTLVHLVLRDARPEMPTDQVRALGAFHQRVLDATAEELDAALQAVQHALEHPFMRRAARSPRLYRELPVTLRTEVGSILEGVIDLVFLEDDVWHIVDFKTDAAVESRRRQYEIQVGWYVHAVTRITGQTAQGYLFVV